MQRAGVETTAEGPYFCKLQEAMRKRSKGQVWKEGKRRTSYAYKTVKWKITIKNVLGKSTGDGIFFLH